MILGLGESTNRRSSHHELSPNRHTVLQGNLGPSCLGSLSILEILVKFSFGWVCPGDIRLLIMWSKSRLNVGHGGRRAKGLSQSIVHFEIKHNLILSYRKQVTLATRMPGAPLSFPSLRSSWRLPQFMQALDLIFRIKYGTLIHDHVSEIIG